MQPSLTFTECQAMRMISHAQNALPNEACGLLGGKSGHVSTVYPGTNSEYSSLSYLLDPVDQWNAMKAIDQSGEDLIGIFHSHPQGLAAPSETDTSQAYYPQATYVILARYNEKGWYMRGYNLVKGQIKEIVLRMLTAQSTILNRGSRSH
jgi:proteasome lid subunit RPN8/RPN11